MDAVELEELYSRKLVTGRSELRSCGARCGSGKVREIADGMAVDFGVRESLNAIGSRLVNMN